MSARPVVVGHDPHRDARGALDAAVRLARDLGADLHVLHSATLASFGADPDTEQYEATRDRMLATERAEVTRALDDSGVPWSYHEDRGDPVRALVHLADEVDARYLVVRGDPSPRHAPPLPARRRVGGRPAAALPVSPGAGRAADRRLIS